MERGVFAVPELQREFVWDSRKACQLLDSIYCNYPIGAMLVWKTNRKNESQLRKQLHILPPFNPVNREIYFLIDGQQRLSVLWNLLNGEGRTVENEDGKKIDFRHILFDPDAEPDERKFFYRGHLTSELRRNYVSVIDLLDESWRRKIHGFGVRRLRQIGECRRRLLEYETQFTFCETRSLSEVRETFVRINSLGTPIGAADRAFARAEKLDLRHMVREVQGALQYGFARLSRTTILQTFAFAFGIKDLGQRAIDAFVAVIEEPEQQGRFRREFPILRESITQATDYMHNVLKVPNIHFLPSEPMMSVLASYFFRNGNVRPTAAAKKRLEQWFWATGVAARYTGRGYRTNLLADIEFVEKLARNPTTRFFLNQKPRVRILRDTDYRRPGPLSNSFFCLLRLRGPRYLDDGSAIPLEKTSSRRNGSDKHHIFPRALLQRLDVPLDRINSILNICYLVAQDNRRIGQKHPGRYFYEVPASARAQSLALRTHLIPSRDGEGIWDTSTRRGFRTFLGQRTRLLAREFEKQAGMQLFDRSEGWS